MEKVLHYSLPIIAVYGGWVSGAILFEAQTVKAKLKIFFYFLNLL